MTMALFTPTFSLKISTATPPHRRRRCSIQSSQATVAVEAPTSSTTDLLLQVKDLSAVIAESKQPILKGVNLTVRHGEVLTDAEFF